MKMKNLIFITILLLIFTIAFSQDKKDKPDVVLKKYQGRIIRMKSEYRKGMELLRSQLIRDYKLRQKQIMKSGDLEGANKIQKKITALEKKEYGVTNELGELGNEFNFDVKINENIKVKNVESKLKKKKEYTTNIAAEATITASSQSKRTNPKNVADGIKKNKWRNAWVTRKESNGAWIEFKWKKPRDISKIILSSYLKKGSKINKADIIFNNKTKIRVDSFPEGAEEVSVDLKKNIKVNSIKIKIIEGTTNKIGLGFTEIEVFGK
ncbi:MAG: hypothetical protein COA79_06010 [Planctomycetota bacterium]|nr:MAG: hypothetical protein COA79_06010 [Planctomycetota bacterium]